MTHPYLSKLGLAQRAAHILEAVFSTRFAWIVLVYTARQTDASEVACMWLMGACPDPCSVRTEITQQIPEDELFVVVRSRDEPLAARACSFDTDLFVAEEDADLPAPHSFLGQQLGHLFLDARKNSSAARAPVR